jgi:hypothetical protein
MESNNETVTIPLQKYKDMEQKIKKLEAQVKENTKVKYIYPPVHGHILLVLLILGTIVVTRWMW